MRRTVPPLVAVHLSRLTPLSFLERSALAFPERPAVVDGESRLTWAEFRERARRLALALQEDGIGRGDRVAFLAPNIDPAAGRALRRAGRRRRAGRDQHAADAGGDRLHPRALGVADARRRSRRSRTSSRARRSSGCSSAARAATTRSSSPRPVRASRSRGSRTRTTRSRSTTRAGRPAGPKGVDVHASRRVPERPLRGASHAGLDARLASTSGRCRCSTATAGASLGR